jgi:hypothetical protein
LTEQYSVVLRCYEGCVGYVLTPDVGLLTPGDNHPTIRCRHKLLNKERCGGAMTVILEGPFRVMEPLRDQT